MKQEDEPQPQPGESDAEYRERIRAEYMSKDNDNPQKGRQAAWEYIASLEGVHNPDRYDEPSA
ncbi:MAG TPA: hypothetical protein VF444_07865 [Pseudonocardiaceae bacterium]